LVVLGLPGLLGLVVGLFDSVASSGCCDIPDSFGFILAVLICVEVL
jgi:hypothetical protein